MKLFYLSLMIGLSSCSVVQVMFTENSANNISVVNKNFVCENDTLRVTYSFWAEDGVMAFIIENKLDVPLYIDWKKSAFISSKNKFDYFTDKEVTNTKGVHISSPFLYRTTYDWSKWYPVNVGLSESTSVKLKEERVTFIPPHSVASRSSYNIFPKKYISMEDVNKQQLGGTDINGKMITYTKDDAIITFRNFITYSTKENFETENYLNNDFFVRKVIEIKKGDLYRFEHSQRFYVKVDKF